MASSHRRSRGEHRRRYTAQRIRRIEGTALLGAAIIAIAFLTLMPSGDRVPSTACVMCGADAGARAVLNLALFVPVGAALALLGLQWRLALAVSFGLSLGVEILQLALPIGRVASIADLAANVAGAAIGLRVTRRRRAILYPRSRGSLRYAIGMAAAWLVVLLITAILLRPSLPTGPYVGEWRPVLGRPDGQAGRVVSATAAGIPVPDGPFADSEAVRDALRNRMQVDARVEFTAAASDKLAGILRLVGDTDDEVLLVAQHGHDLLFRSRVLAAELRLVTPSVVMLDALEGLSLAQAKVLPIEGRRDGGALRLIAYGRETTLPLHSGLGWMLLIPPSSPIVHVPGMASAIWIGLPLFLIAYWTGRRARRKARRRGDAFRLTGTGGQVLAALPVLAAVVVTGLAGISLLLGLSLPGATVWASAATAVVIGILSGISTALSHDERTHGLSSTAARSAGSEPVTVSGGYRAIP